MPVLLSAIVMFAFNLLAMVSILSTMVAAGSNTSSIQVCLGDFALCFASTCKPTGGQILVNVNGGNKTYYPAASCTCPILNGKSYAHIDGGNMNGSCATPSLSTVWSLFSSLDFYPQQANNFTTVPKSATKSVDQYCPGQPPSLVASYVDCWSFLCNRTSLFVNGTQIADCLCPIGSGSDGLPIPVNLPWLTQAGQGNPSACNHNPVGGYLKAFSLTPTSTPTLLSYTESPSNGGSSAATTGLLYLGTGAVAGIAVGAVVLAGLLVTTVLIWWYGSIKGAFGFCRKQPKGELNQALDDENGSVSELPSRVSNPLTQTGRLSST